MFKWKIYIRGIIIVLLNLFSFFSDCRVTEPELAAKDEEVSRELWETSCSIVNLGSQYNPFEPQKDIL